MKITIISYDNWGLNSKLVKELQSEKEEHLIRHINFHKLNFRYPTFFHRIYNCFLKIFLKQNLKHISYGKYIINELQKNEKQDLIICIKGDFIDKNYIQKIKKHSKKTVAFFNDSASRCPNIKNVYSAFDHCFSFEKKDCYELNMDFLTNWIITKPSPKSEFQYKISNVSSMDYRFNILDRIASELTNNEINYKFIVLKNKKNYKSRFIEIIENKLSLQEINELNHSSEILLDINRDKQEGLSFRIFECLGYEKKIITTNQDVKNYNFYHPENILVIDKEHPKLIQAFFHQKFNPIHKELTKEYTPVAWLNKITQSLYPNKS